VLELFEAELEALRGQSRHAAGGPRPIALSGERGPCREDAGRTTTS